jgi:hypothetical protein
MDVAILIVVAVVLLLVVVYVGSPSWRAERDAARAEDRLHYDGDRQFKRPRNEGDLL